MIKGFRRLGRIAAIGALVALGGCAATGVPGHSTIERTLLKDIELLASEEYEGRFPGTEGGRKTVEFQIERLKALGYEPGYIGEYTQPVTLTKTSVSDPVLTIEHGKDRALVTGDDVYVLGFSADTKVQNAPLVAVAEVDDETLPKLAGKAVLLDNTPPGDPLFGAVYGANPAVIILSVEDDDRMGRVKQAASGSSYSLGGGPNGSGPPILYLASEATERMFAGSRISAAGMFEKAGKSGGLASSKLAVSLVAKLSEDQVQTANVIGRLPGSKPGSGAVMLLAHWDHLGNECGNEGDEDRLCNGAVDNASGVAAMLEVARIIAAGPPLERDLYIMGNTAEELGLLGARAFADNPPVPHDYFVATFSLDTLALAPKGAPLTIVGYGTTPLDEGMEAVAEKLGRTLDIRDEDQQFTRRHDGAALMAKGIPSVLVSSSFGDREALASYLEKRYHGPADEVDHEDFELGGVASDVAYYVELVRHFGSTANYMPPEPEKAAETPATE